MNLPNIKQFKEEIVSQAIKELKEENSENEEFLQKLEYYQKNNLQSIRIF